MPILQTLKTSLHQRLEGAAKVAVLGVGSELRADDAAGLLVTQRLQEIQSGEVGSGKPEVGSEKSSNFELRVFIGGTAPENLTGEIKRFAPTHLVIIDAADLDAEPGTMTLMDPDSIGGTTFCTHSLPLKVMIDYLLDSFARDPKRDTSRLGRAPKCEMSHLGTRAPCQVIILGVQPKTLAVGAPVSQEVRDAVESLVAMLCDDLIRD